MQQKQTNTEKVINHIREHGIIYLLNDEYDRVVRIAVKKKSREIFMDDNIICYAKAKGDKEYRLGHTTKVVSGAILQGNIITKKAYDEY